MADHSKPTQTSGYIDFVQQLDYRFDDLARGLDPAKSPVGDATISNLPVDSVGWSSETSNWRRWTGSVWEPLTSTYAINISGTAATVTNGVYTTGTQTINGTKTFSNVIIGSINGNAATVTNGVYTSGDQVIAGVKQFTSTIAGSINGNAATVTNGVYTSGDQTIAGVKTFSSTITGSVSGSSGSCSGNAATATLASTVTVNYNNNSNSTYQMLWGSGNSVYGTAGIYCNPFTDYVYATAFNCDNWFRSTGTTGWYNETYSVGIYATETGNVRTYNNANFISGGDVTAYSDETVKTNWRELPSDYIERLAKVKYGIYDRTDCKKTQVGCGAQSLQSLLPNAIVKDADGKLSVAYGNAAMVSSIKLAERVVEQDARIAELERLISKLIGE